MLLAALITGCPPPEIPKTPDPEPQCGALEPAPEGMFRFCMPEGAGAHYVVGLQPGHGWRRGERVLL